MSSLCISSQFQKFGVHLTGKKNPFFICSVHLLSLDNSAWDDLGPEELSPVIPVGNKSMFSDPESWFVFMVSTYQIFKTTPVFLYILSPLSSG